MTAPVFGPDGRIALMITASGPARSLSSDEAEELVLRVKEAAALASTAIADSPEGLNQIESEREIAVEAERRRYQMPAAVLVPSPRAESGFDTDRMN